MLGAGLSACNLENKPAPLSPFGPPRTFPQDTPRNGPVPPLASATFSCSGTLFAPDGTDRANNDGREVIVHVQATDVEKEHVLYENGTSKVVLQSHEGNVSLATRIKADDRQVGYALANLGTGTVQLGVNESRVFSWMICNRQTDPAAPLESTPVLVRWTCRGTLFGKEGGDSAPNNGRDIDVVALLNDVEQASVLYENDGHRIVFGSHQGQLSLTLVSKDRGKHLGYGKADLKSRTLQFKGTGQDVHAWTVCSAR